MFSPTQWLLLIVLSVLWGGSFLFVGIAVRDVPALTIVLVRVTLAAALLVPVVWAFGHRLPTGRAWWPFLVMSLLNNVVPFSAIALGQTEIASGLASVLNATTPLFGLLATHALTTDRMTPAKLVGVVIGIAGVGILIGPAALGLDTTSVRGMALVLAGAASYGLASVWGRRLRATPPLVSAAAQLACSSLVLALIAGIVDRPWTLARPSAESFAALAGLAVLSTAVAYVIFFRILEVSGALAVMLVTLLIPISGVTMGVLVLGEGIDLRHILGALVIASGLMVIDGRLWGWLTSGRPPSR